MKTIPRQRAELVKKTANAPAEKLFSWNSEYNYEGLNRGLTFDCSKDSSSRQNSKFMKTDLAQLGRPAA